MTPSPTRSSRALAASSGAPLLALSLALPFLVQLSRPASAGEPAFRRGDTNADGRLDLSDAVATLGYLFLGDAEPGCLDSADADDSGVLDLTDGVFSLAYLFSGGEPPPAPGPMDCGADPTVAGDVLDCVSYPACEGSSGSDSVESSLRALEIDTTPTPRRDASGEPVPDGYDPFGGAIRTGRGDELFFMGFSPSQSPERYGTATMARVRPEGSGRYGTEFLWTPDDDTTTWAESPEADDGQRLHTACAADVDGDGLDEVVVVQHRDDVTRVRVVPAAVFTGGREGPERSVGGRVRGVRDVAAAAGDVDGDGRAELVVVLSLYDRTTVRIIGLEDDTFAIETSLDIDPARDPTQLGRSYLQPYSAAVAVSDLDQDGIDEIALVTNEGNREVASLVSQRRILDDVGAGLAAVFQDSVQSCACYPSCHCNFGLAGVATGDFDGDGIDEVAFARMGGDPDSGFAIEPRAYIAVDIRDDASGDYREWRSREGIEARPIACGLENGGFDGGGIIGGGIGSDCRDLGDLTPRRIFVVAGDFDGDGRSELGVNEVVLGEDLRPIGELDDEDIRFQDPSAVTVAVADLFGTGREHIVCFSKFESIRVGRMNAEVSYWGIEGGRWRKLISDDCCTYLYSVTPAWGFSDLPTIVAGNFDGAVLEYRRSEQVFTEPVVNAVLAAPPCQSGIGQNTEVCTTSFGASQSTGGGVEQSFTVSASRHVGYEASFSVLGVEVASAELKATVTASATTLDETSYELTRSIIYTTGANEDAVIVTTVPFDRYVYEVVAHPNADMIGAEMVVSLPRAPITVMVEREYYNARVAGPGSPRIDEAVLSHTIGEVSSYPTTEDRDALLDEFGGLASEVGTVGPGRGQFEIGITFDEETTEGYSFEVGASLEMSTTAGGVMSGFSVGVSAGSTIRYTKGTSTHYSGVVGQIDPDRFQGGYSVGLFTYVYEDPESGQAFEVVSYWMP